MQYRVHVALLCGIVRLRDAIECEKMYMYICTHKRTHLHAHLHTRTHTHSGTHTHVILLCVHMYAYIFHSIYVCVVCVCMEHDVLCFTALKLHTRKKCDEEIREKCEGI